MWNNMYISLGEGDLNIMLPESGIDGKTQFAFDVLHIEALFNPEEQLEI